MNDMEKFKKLFDEVGLKYNDQPYCCETLSEEFKENNILLSQGSEKVEGYAGFYAQFEFDKDNDFKFKEVVLYE